MQKYLILCSTNVQELIESVNAKIDEGFLPIGGVSFIVPEALTKSKILICQAMLHYTAKSIAETRALVESNAAANRRGDEQDQEEDKH